jgi:Periplasmic protein TonB, links inner and outer membranes
MLRRAALLHDRPMLRRFASACVALLTVSLIATSLLPQAQAQTGLRPLLTGSQVSPDFIPLGSSDDLTPGGRASYSVILENDLAVAQQVDATIALPEGMRYIEGSLRVNGLPSQQPVIDAGANLSFPGLHVPAAQGGDNLAGIHVFFHEYPTIDEVEERLAWAANLVGPGGTIKIFHPSITERTTEPYEWAVYAVRRIYEMGMRPVVRLGFANGDASSFTRRHDDPVGQMNRYDAANEYQGIATGVRNVVAGLLAQTADLAAQSPSGELTVIVGNEPNLEWVERDWFIDYEYVRQPDGSFDTSWLTTDPNDPDAAANNPNGWKLFVRGLPTSERPVTYDTRLDDYTYYLGYDGAVEFGRFLRTTSRMLKELENPRLMIAAGAIASGGGDIYGRYAYHQRHFMRRMLQSVPDALAYVDLWTTNNYPYTLPPDNNYHNHPANFDRYPLGEQFWHTEIGIDSYRGDLDYLAYLKRRGIAQSVPTRAIIGEVGYGIGPGWGTEFGGPHITEDLRAQYMSDIFERYYNTWRDELAGVNLWQLGDPDHNQPTYHMFDMVYPNSASLAGWPTNRHLVYDAIATRASRPGPGRLIVSFEVQLAESLPSQPLVANLLLSTGQTASYTLYGPNSRSEAQPNPTTPPAPTLPPLVDPDPSEPAAPEPDPSEPAAPEPEPSEPAAPEPEPSEPAAPEPEPSEEPIPPPAPIGSPVQPPVPTEPPSEPTARPLGG